MIGATSLSSRVQSAASWSKRPPSSCYRWRLPDVPRAHKRTSPPIPPSSPRAMPGTAPAKIPITRALLQNQRARPDPSATGRKPGFSPIQRNGGRRRTASRLNGTPGSTVPSSSARDACGRSRSRRIPGSPRRPIEASGRSGLGRDPTPALREAAGGYNAPSFRNDSFAVGKPGINSRLSGTRSFRISPLRQPLLLAPWQGPVEAPRSEASSMSEGFLHGAVGTG
jgi:hypothetical protein